MSTSTRKIVAGLLAFAMVLTMVVGLTAAPAGAQTASFTRSLTVGSRGADVMQLQTLLQEMGFFTATPTGYFGPVTKRAVAEWQASVGITPAAGYFGPISRAQIGQGTVVPPVTTVPGCPAGAVYNYLTGAPCTTTGTTTPPVTPISTTEGSLTVTAAATPANNASIQTNIDVPVYGLDLKAQIGDVVVNRMDLDIAVTVNSTPSATENPGNFINGIKIMNGSTVVKSWSVGTSDFITGSTANQYYVRLSGIGFVVPKDTTKTLTVAFSTNSGIDTSRTVVIKGYGTNSLLTTSGNNITSYYDVSGIIRTQTFQKPGVSTLSAAADASNPISQTIRINDAASGATNATLMTFAAKSETGDSKITAITINATSSGAAANGPSALYLYDGSTLLGSFSFATWVAQTNQAATFTNLSVIVPKDITKTLTVTADMPAATAAGTVASTTVASITYQKPNGSSAVLTPNIQGNNQYFYPDSPQWTLVSAVAASTGANTTGSTTGLTATFVLKAKPVGGSMTIPTENDFTIQVASSSSSVRLGAASSVSVAGDPTLIPDGSEVTITVTSVVGDSTFTGLASGSLTSEWFTISGATSTVGASTIQQTWGLGSWKTNPVTYVQ